MLYQTHVRVHLDNIRFNIEGIRNAVGPERKILIAVKANAQLRVPEEVTV